MSKDILEEDTPGEKKTSGEKLLWAQIYLSGNYLSEKWPPFLNGTSGRPILCLKNAHTPMSLCPKI
jgi:hypothetical protein